MQQRFKVASLDMSKKFIMRWALEITLHVGYFESNQTRVTRATNPHIERIWTGLVVRLYWTDAAEHAKPHEPATKPPKPHADVLTSQRGCLSPRRGLLSGVLPL